MMAGKVFVFALLVAAAFAQEGTFSVLSTPSYLSFDASAGAVKGSEVPSVLANVLGFETAETRVSWGGVINHNVFKRPSAVLSFVFDGVEATLPFAKPVATFPLTEAHATFVLSGSQHASLATLVSEIAGSSSFNLAVSADSELTAAALPRDLSTSRDVGVSFSDAGFTDAAGTLAVSNKEISQSFADGLLGAGVVYNAKAHIFTVGTTVFDLSNPSAKAFFVELHASLLSLTKALALPQARPSTFTLAISSARRLPYAQQAAAATVLAAFADKATALVSAAFAGNVVSVASTTNGQVEEHHHRVARAAANSAAPAPAFGRRTSGIPRPTDTDFIAYCQTYTCYCNSYTFPNGTSVAFNPSTGCVSPCPDTGICPCAYLGCACDSKNFQAGASRCSACQPGFILQGGQCYVSSNFPGMVQIWLWGGLIIVVALIATCYAIGGMDPGRNGIIYRMTNQRAKTN